MFDFTIPNLFHFVMLSIGFLATIGAITILFLKKKKTSIKKED